MPDLSLKKILIRNWMTCREAALEFPSHGLVWVSGVVGAGKTALGEAICRTLIGVGGRFSRLGEFSSHEKGNLYVRLEAELKGRPLVVESGHRCSELSKTGEGLRFTYDGRRVERGHIEETRQELTQAVRVSPKLARWAVFIDGAKLEFSDLPEKDAVELLMESLAQPPWTQWHENAKKTMASFETGLAQAETEHATATRQRATAASGLESAKKDLDKAKMDYAGAVEKQAPELIRKKARLEEFKAAAATARQRLTEIKDVIRQLEEANATEYHQLEIERQAFVDKLAQEKGGMKMAVDVHSQIAAEVRQANKSLSDMLAVPASCPKCNRPWDQAHSEQEIASARAAIAEANSRLAAAAQMKANVEKISSDLHDKIEAIDQISGGLRKKVRTKIDAVSRDAERLEEERDNADSDAADVLEAIRGLEQGPSTSGMERAEAIVNERAAALEKAEKATLTASAAIVEAQEAVKVVRYWVKAFSPVGVPNMVLKDSISPLNDTSRRISATLTGGTLNVSYDTSREMATGQERAKLVVNVEHRHGTMTRTGNIKGSSKGQSGLTNLIVAETLSAVGNVSSRIGFRWYDEVLNSQEPLIRRATLAYMKELAHRLKILIFIVDHHPEPASYADRILLVDLDEHEATSMKWAT
jgi:DNA repair exonuclease SbcCD ATPase subunit